MGETFAARDGAVDFGKDYEYLMAAYYALTFSLNDEIVDFKISTNNNDFGDFDDVVIELELTNGDQHVFAIQLKHVVRVIALIKLTTENKQFGLKKYSDDFQKVKKTYNKHRSYNAPFEHFHFILFSNSVLEKFEEIDEKGKRLETKIGDEKVESDITILKVDDVFGKKFFNLCNEKESFIYNFETAKKGSTDEEFFRQFHFYTKQKSAKEVESLMAEVIFDRFKHCDQNVVIKYLSYFSYWCRQDFGTFKLTKQDVRLKLAEFLLTPHIPEPDLKDMVSFPEGTFELISRLVCLFKIFVMEDPSDIAVNYLWSIFLEQFKDFSVNWSTPLPGVFSNMVQKLTELPMSALNEHFHEMSMMKIYLTFWHLDAVPLIINSTNEVVPVGINLCKNQDNMKNIVILGRTNIENDLEKFVFKNLSDLVAFKDTFDMITEALSLTFQQRRITLRQFISCDDRLMKIITMEEILLMVGDSFVIGDRSSKILPQYFITRRIPKILIDSKIIDEIGDDIFVISHDNNFENEFNINMIDIDKYLLIKQAGASKNYVPKQLPISHFEKFDNNENVPDRLLITVKGHCTKQQFEDICHLNPHKNCHLLRFVDKIKLEWIESFGQIEHLKQYQYTLSSFEPEDFVEDEEVFNYFTGKVNLICADPGMGKSVLMEILKLKCPFTHMIFAISLNEHYNFFKPNQSSEEIMQYFCQIQKKNSLLGKVVDVFLSQKKIVFFWDCFDEIPTEFVDSVIGAMKILSSHGYLQWISARSSSKDLLENAFNTFALTLAHFSQRNQYDYIWCHLKEKYQDEEEITEVANVMNQNISNSLDCGYFNYSGIPLHIRMLVEIFLMKPETQTKDLQIVTLTDIYHEFIKGKFDTLFQKAEADPENYLMQQIEQQYKDSQLTLYEIAAMKACLNEDTFLSLELDCVDFLEELSNSEDILGLIIKVNANKKPIFAHKTYEEFLAASWLAKNCRKQPKLIKELFLEQYTNIRLMFDMLLGKQSPVHLAVLYRNLEVLEEHKDEIEHFKDKERRNALQVACAWGRKHPHVSIQDTETTPVVNRTSEQIQKYYLDLLQYLQRYIPTVKEIVDIVTSPDGLQTAEKFISRLCQPTNSGNSVCETDPNAILINAESLIKITKEDEKYLNVIRFLLAHKCNPFETDTLFDWNAFQYADHTLSLAAIDLMLHCNSINLDSLNNYKHIPTLVHHSVAYLYDHVLDLVEDVPYIEYRYEHGKVTLLQVAAEANNLKATEKLLTKTSYQAMINAQSAFLGTPLNSAVFHGNMEMILVLLENGARVSNYATPPLLTAAFAGRRDCCELLLQAGADANELTPDGNSALTAAIGINQPEIVKLLLQNGANVDHVYSDMTCCDLAVFHNNTKVLSILLEYKPNLGFQNGSTGYTTLHYASQFSDVGDLKQLLDCGADPKIKAAYQEITPLLVALCSGKKENALELVWRDPSVVNECMSIKGDKQVKFAPLHYAVLQDWPDVIEALIENGAHVQGDESSAAPLQIAVEKGFDKSVVALLEAGASVNRVNGQGLAPLVFAIHNISTLNILLDHGADINFKNSSGLTALHYASFQGKFDAVKELLNRGADIECKSDNETCGTPLYYAVAGKQLEIAKFLFEKTSDKCDGVELLCKAAESDLPDFVALLLDHGIEVNAVDKNGYAALFYASPDCVDVLLKNGANPSAVGPVGSVLLGALIHEKSDILQKLLEAGADPNVQTNSQSPLHLAVTNSDIFSVILLIKFEANVNAVDDNGRTPLHCLISNQMTAMFKHGDSGAFINCNNEACAVELIANNANINQKDKFGNTPLHFICERGLGTLIKIFVESGADVNVSNNKSETPLFYACSNNNKEIVKMLLEKSCNVNVQKNDGNTPLHVAAVEGHHEIVKMLCQAGGNVHLKNAEGSSPLHVAAKFGFYQSSRILLEEGALLDQTNNAGVTPLHFAISAKSQNLVKLFIDRGAKIDQDSLLMAVLINDLDIVRLLKEKETNLDFNKGNLTYFAVKSETKNVDLLDYLLRNGSDPNQLNALHFACELDEIEYVECLLRNGADVNRVAVDSDDRTPLMSAVSLQVATLLLDRGASIDQKDKDGWTALLFASFRGDVEMVKFLHQMGASLSVESHSGSTPLLEATNHLSVVKYLIENGCIVNHQDNEGNSVLYKACSNNNYEVVVYLIDNHADVNITTKNNLMAPIHIAACKGNLDVVKYLVAHGANIAIRSKSNFTALSWAAFYNQIEVLKFFAEQKLSHFSDDDLSKQWQLCFNVASVRNHIDVMKFLYEQGLANIDDPDPSNSFTPLHRVCYAGSYDSAVYLIKEGADINAKTAEGFVPAYIASWQNKFDIIKLLVEHRADIDIPNHHGNTALFSAAADGYFDIVKFLHTSGAKIHVVDEDGDAPLHDAAARGYLPIVKYFVENGADVNLKNNNGKTPLDLARDNAKADVVEFLTHVDVI